MLVKKMDDLVVLRQDKKLAAVVNFLGETNDETKEKIKEFGEELDLKKVPLAVTTDTEPLKINDAAEVTVMIYRGKTVKAELRPSQGQAQPEDDRSHHQQHGKHAQ